MVRSNNLNSHKLPKTILVISVIILIALLIISAYPRIYIGCNNQIYGGRNACIASSGFLCQSPVYLHTTGQISVTIGQATGTNWASANFVFVPQGTACLVTNPAIPNISFISYPANTMLANMGLITGQTATLTLPVNGSAPIAVGTAVTGAIWVQYTKQGSSTSQYHQIAEVQVKAS